MQKFRDQFIRLQHFVNKWWYAPLLGLLACIDLFVLLIPTDGLMISSVMIRPKKWISIALFTAFGSTLGSLALAFILEKHGLPFLLEWKPGIDQTSFWIWTDHLMHQWGSWTLFLIALSPLVQHPAIAIGAFAQIPLLEFFIFILAGRILKYFFLSWLASHSPKYLYRLWGIQEELKELDIPSKDEKKK